MSIISFVFLVQEAKFKILLLLTVLSLLSYKVNCGYYDESGELAFLEGLLARGHPAGRVWSYGTTVWHDFPYYGYHGHGR